MIDDLRQAWRGLRAMPLVAAVVVLSLGLGIGANTTVFSWLQMVRWKPLPGVADAATLQVLEMRTDSGVYLGTSWAAYQDLEPHATRFAWLVAARPTPVAIGEAPAIARAAALLVSGNYFEALDLEPAAGRLLTRADAVAPGREPVTVIAFDYWRTHFGGDRTAIGRRLRVNGQTVTIVGVAPPRFQGTTLGLAFDLWLPATMAGVLVEGSRELVDRSQRGYSVIGRVRAGTTPAAAVNELERTAARLARATPRRRRHARRTARLQRSAARAAADDRRHARPAASAHALVLLAVCGQRCQPPAGRASVRQHDFGCGSPWARRAGGSRGWCSPKPWCWPLPARRSASGWPWWGTQALRAGEISERADPVSDAIDGVGMAVAIGLGGLAATLAAATPAWALTDGSAAGVREAVRRASRSGLRETLMGSRSRCRCSCWWSPLVLPALPGGRDSIPASVPTVCSSRLRSHRPGHHAGTQPAVRERRRRRAACDPGRRAAALAGRCRSTSTARPQLHAGRPRRHGYADRALANVVTPATEGHGHSDRSPASTSRAR